MKLLEKIKVGNTFWEIEFNDNHKRRSENIDPEIFRRLVKRYDISKMPSTGFYHSKTHVNCYMFENIKYIPAIKRTFPDEVIDVIVDMFKKCPSFPMLILIDNNVDPVRFSIDCHMDGTVMFGTLNEFVIMKMQNNK